MARNAIQFQDGLSLSGFLKRYGSEEQCEDAVRRWRWPDGFRCPKCGEREHGIVGKRRLYEYHACGRQTSLKASTIFAHSRVPLTTWFQAMWFITQSKGSISTLELSRQLDLKWDSAWLMRQKLGAVMLEDEAARKLDGRIEMMTRSWVARRANWRAESAVARGPTRSLSSSPWPPPMTAGRSACCYRSPNTLARTSSAWHELISHLPPASSPTASAAFEP